MRPSQEILSSLQGAGVSTDQFAVNALAPLLPSIDPDETGRHSDVPEPAMSDRRVTPLGLTIALCTATAIGIALVLVTA